jgi:tetratricopeptide (TPR) repeat protein
VPTYLYTATHPGGIKQVLRIQAASLEAAHHQLLADGHSQVTFHNEDLTAALRGPSNSLDQLTPQVELEMRNRGRLTRGEIMLQSLNAPLIFYFILVGLLGWSIYSGNYLFFLAGLTVYLAAFGSLLSLRKPAIYFDQLLTAREWKRWDQVLKLADQLEALSQSQNSGASGLTFLFYRCQALAASGHLDRAVQEFQQAPANGNIPRWAHLAQLASIYICAKAFDDAIRTLQEAIALNPRCSSLHLCLVEQLIFQKRDVVGASQAIAKTGSLESVDLMAPMVKACRAGIELESGNFSRALDLFNQALDGFRQIERQPLIFSHTQTTKTYLCLAYSHLGKKDIAVRYFNEVKGFMKATGESELLQRCELTMRAGKN